MTTDQKAFFISSYILRETREPLIGIPQLVAEAISILMNYP